MEFLTVSFNGFLSGIVYAQMALGLSLLYGVMRLINFAHGEMITGGMIFLCVVERAFQINPFFSMLMLILFYILIFFILQMSLFKHLIGRPDTIQFIAMAAFSMILLNLNLIIFNADTYSLQFFKSFQTITFFDVTMNESRLIACALSLSSAAVLFSFFRFSLIGKAIKAVSLNRQAAIFMGLPIHKIFTICLVITAFLMGVSALSLLMIMDVSVQSAPEITLTCFIIVILGGLGHIHGTIIAGLLIGIVEAYTSYYGSPLYKGLSSFVILIFLLILRPQGLLGKR